MADRTDAFKQGLRDLGYVEGKNLVVEWRYAEDKPDRLREMAADLARLKVDVIVTGGNTATEAAKKATRIIPIVMTRSSDPVLSGFIASLARPGGNVTGLAALGPELAGKQRTEIAELAVKHRLPVSYESARSVVAGGLMSYGANLLDSDRYAATYVDKLLKGRTPADLPVEQPTKFEFVINLKAAKAIDLTIPPNVLARATRVIR